MEGKIDPLAKRNQKTKIEKRKAKIRSRLINSLTKSKNENRKSKIEKRKSKIEKRKSKFFSETPNQSISFARGPNDALSDNMLFNFKKQTCRDYGTNEKFEK